MEKATIGWFVFVVGTGLAAGVVGHLVQSILRRRLAPTPVMVRQPEGAPATLAVDNEPDGGLLVSIIGPTGHLSVTLPPPARAALLRQLIGTGALRPELANIREEVAVFALAMERRFRDHDDTKGWPPRAWPFGREGVLQHCRQELDHLVRVSNVLDGQAMGEDRLDLVDAAADVANLALLVLLWHDTAGAVAATPAEMRWPETIQ